ncbi:MAG: OmpA family protein [bacterium]|nr:OmpA family protein [bacterium]
MLKRYFYLFAFVVSVAGTTFSQISAVFSPMERADKLYKNGEYFRAIPIYKKEARSKDPAHKQDSYVKLGNCYKAINNYPSAEDAYKNATESGGEIEPEVYYNYAQILKTNNKYEEAATQYDNYLKVSPNDERAKKARKFCKEVKSYLSKPIEYKVTNVGAINTEKAEFSPYVMNNKLMFIAERANFDFVSYEVSDYSGQPYFNMYVSAISDKDLKKEKPFSKNINTAYDDGPGCLSPDGMMLYFTRSDYVNKKNFVNQAKIYTAVSSDKSWKKIKPIELNNDDYSIAHPSISSDNTMLFFTSNMPGGFGGKDIWVSTRTGESWGEPVNLGPDINTSGDEMFPSVRKDGVLFFSSNGLPGFGGLDIYTAKQEQGKWIMQRNEGLDINSSADDFGITFLNDTVGYFSSNRAGGKGNDDIYRYEYNPKSMVISGSVLLTENIEDKAKGKKVVLMDENGNAVDSTVTDAKGYFEFKNLDPDKKYMTSIDEEDPELSGKARFFLADNDSTIHRVTGKYKNNRFVFKNLPVDPNGLPEMYTEDDLVFAGTLVRNDKEGLKNVKLKLVNDFGDVVEETTTNEFGAFAFRNIPSDQNYMVSVVDEGALDLPEGTKITLNNKVGKEVRSFYKGKGAFTFKVLNTDQTLLNDMSAEDANLEMGIYGYMYDQDKRPLPNIKLHVKDEDGSNPRDWVTTDAGKFDFTDLSAAKNYIFETDANDPGLKGVEKIYIADNKGRVYKIVDLSNGKFSFRILEEDKFSLGEFVLVDPWLKVTDTKKEVKKGKKDIKEPEPEEESELSITIVENIYYPYGVWEIDADGMAVLDRAVDALNDYPKLVMEISSHTDSQSSSEFNLGLSKKRAQTAVDYVVSKGISPTRLKATGYGETRLLNKCADGVECSDAEHKINRRTEFKITKPIKR